MINTFFGMDMLSSTGAMLAALVIGLAFGYCLEQAGFGSSRRLAGIFYFRDMAVLKVMFTAVVVAMLGLRYALELGLIRDDQLFFMPSVYGAQIVGGLIFGVGFVMGGWCPGTAAVGLVSGRLDALVFLGGAGIGSIFFNELFVLLQGLYTWGDSGVQFAWQALGLSPGGLAFLIVAAALLCFWGAEYLEKRVSSGGNYWRTPFLWSFSFVLVVLASGLLAVQGRLAAEKAAEDLARTVAMLAEIEAAGDHMGPEELADRLMGGEPGLLLVDIRPAGEYAEFHIPGAVNISLSDLPAALSRTADRGIVVLYSNGMTHPAQARDALVRLGHTNVYILTDGILGFVEHVLKPVSLRVDPLTDAEAERVNAWRQYFSNEGKAMPGK